ncbi:MAG: putative lipid II flippase FtsW, partial [Actinomycetota bacterium]
MATISADSQLTPAERRRAVLNRTGKAQENRLATDVPSKVYYGIVGVITVLVVFGLIMVLSSSSIVSINNGGSAWYMFRKQLAWSVCGFFALLVTYRMPYHIWHTWVKYVLAIGVGLMMLPFSPIGVTINGARAWAEIGPVRFQPSEILKVAVLLYCASVLGRRRKEIENVQRTFMPIVAVWFVSVALCMIQKDFGAAIVFTCVILSTMFVAGTPLRLIGTIGALTVLGSVVAISASSRMQQRFLSFLDLQGNKGHSAYQVWQSILSISNGGITGVGAGRGTGKWGYVPLAHSDFIFAIVAEEFGLIGSTMVIGLFLALALLGIQVALRARDPFGAVLAGGITTWLCIQATINIGGVIGALPVTGLTLPFISYGRSSLFMVMAASGLLLNVARNM